MILYAFAHNIDKYILLVALYTEVSVNLGLLWIFTHPLYSMYRETRDRVRSLSEHGHMSKAIQESAHDKLTMAKKYCIITWVSTITTVLYILTLHPLNTGALVFIDSLVNGICIVQTEKSKK